MAIKEADATTQPNLSRRFNVSGSRLLATSSPRTLAAAAFNQTGSTDVACYPSSERFDLSQSMRASHAAKTSNGNS